MDADINDKELGAEEKDTTAACSADGEIYVKDPNSENEATGKSIARTCDTKIEGVKVIIHCGQRQPTW